MVVLFRVRSIPLLLFMLFFVSRAFAVGVVGTDWTTSITGAIPGVSTVTVDWGAASISTFDLSGADYSAAPLGSSQEAVSHSMTVSGASWTATFGTPVTNLRLYGKFWRGSAFSASPADYDFSNPFTIASGFASGSVSGNTLTLPTTGYHDGILLFAGPISALTVGPQTSGGSGIVTTFGADAGEPSDAIPEPSTFVLS